MYKVVINAGHGGTETGAIATNEEYEKDVNLDVVKYFKELSEKYQDKIQFEYTRLEDKTMSLKQRVVFANENKADLYISIHHNASGVGATGSETIHSIHGGEGEKLAGLIMAEFEKLGQNKRRVFSKKSEVDHNNDYYYEIRYTAMPSVITEFSFLDSDDFLDIDNQIERKGEAQAILNAILKHFNMYNEKKEKIESWKEDILYKSFSKGMFKDYNLWKSKIDEPMPAWAVMAMIYNMHK
jgi:N-acetylmuramoyl-L-alanine amidase